LTPLAREGVTWPTSGPVLPRTGFNPHAREGVTRHDGTERAHIEVSTHTPNMGVTNHAYLIDPYP